MDGRTNFICTDKLLPFVDHIDLSSYENVKGRLVEFIKYPPKYAPLIWNLLGKTIIVDSVRTAVDLSEKLGSDYWFVTLQGQLVAAGGTIKLGPLGKTTGLISRKSRQVQLQDTIQNINAEIAQIENNIQTQTQKQNHLEKLCQELRTATYEANTEKVQVASNMAVHEQDIKRLTDEEPLIASEIELLESQIAQSVQNEYNSKQKLEELETVNAQRATRIEELEATFQQQNAQLLTQTDQLTELKISLGQAEEQSKALKITIASIKRQLQENQSLSQTAQTQED